MCSTPTLGRGVWDHPREYGENHHRPNPSPVTKGSSPRIRGELVDAVQVAGVDGIIPANTGRIRRPSQWIAGVRDHPREYGENAIRIPLAIASRGSSPRIRGEYYHDHPKPRRPGIIPANTGRIVSGLIDKVDDRDHPREYGENRSLTSRIL